MFNKLKEFCTFKKKENLMTTTGTDNKTTKQLKKEVSAQAQEIGRLRGRIGDLRDEISLVTSEMNNFKNRVADDIRKVVRAINEVDQRNNKRQ